MEACIVCTGDPDATLCEDCVAKLSHVVGDSEHGDYCATCGSEPRRVQSWLASRDQLAGWGIPPASSPT